MTRGAPLLCVSLTLWLLGAPGCGNKDSGSGKGGGKTTAYKRKAMATEARLTLRKIATGAKIYYERGVVSRSGQVLTPRFPRVSPTPDKVPCGKQPQRVKLSPKQRAAWSAVGVDLADPVRFQYQILSTGKGKDAAFTARALGDLDCDGEVSTYEITGRPDAEFSVRFSPLKVVKGLE